MRERTDKSFPNSYETAAAVARSIANPVTKEILYEAISRRTKGGKRTADNSDSALMPPPAKLPRKLKPANDEDDGISMSDTIY